MSARKARKLADGSREEIFDESDNFSADEEFSFDENQEDSDMMETLAPTDSTENELLADCGTIESLTLTNFMCHDHFEITFNPRVNFVIGNNGSGKSAILTAIVIVLGGRATNTGRGQSLTGFIKNGKQSAKIAIKLCNFSTSKKKTFKFEEYGRSIIVERIIKIDGTSNYILKSGHGKIVSRKKEDLNDFINLFSIQIENPVCILSQEISRNFLNSKNPRDKYDFFMKATNLEQLKQSYALAMQQSTTAKDILAKKKGFLPAIELEVKELEKKVDVFRKFNEKRDQLKNLLCELLWSAVKELEEEEKEPPKTINEIDKKIKEATERFEEIKCESIELEKIKNDYNDSMQTEYEEQIKRLHAKKDEFQKRLEQFRKTRAEKQFKVNEINFAISGSNKDKAQLEKKIEDIKKQIAQQEKLIAEQERIKAKKIELQNEQDKIKSEIESIKVNKENKQNEYNKINETIKSINYKINRCQSDLSNKNNLLQNLQGSEKNILAKFGTPMIRIVKTIEEENRKGKFRKKPVGPLGYYIKLKDNHISTALESCLKGLMYAFVCDNLQDADYLVKLIRQVGFRQTPLIIKRKFGPRFHIRNQVTLDKYKSFLSYITIENDQVFNIIMDKSNLDQTLYIPNDSTAVELLTNENLVPPGLKVAYSKVGTQFYPKKNGSNFRQYSNNKEASGILTSDTSELIKKVTTEIEDLKEKMQELQAEKRELEVDLKKLTSELKEFDKEIDTNRSKMNNISRELYELGSVKEFKPEDLSIFETEYQDCVNQLANSKEQLQKLKDDLKDIEEKIKIIKNDQLINDQDIQECKVKFESIKKKVRENEFLLQKNKEDMEKIEKRVAIFNERKDVCMQQLTDIKIRKNQAIERAQKDGEKAIDTNRKPDEIQTEIDELNQFLKENEGKLGDREQLFSAYKEKNIHLEKIKDQIEFLEKYINEFSGSIKKRAAIYCKLRNYITKEASKNFSKNLKLLNFTGSLKVYHKSDEINGKLKKAQTLEIKINPKSSDPEKMYNDTRSLSGGERSFSTVAFLIALWDSSYSPFNILDEVDVFMDNVVRNMAIDALLAAANKKQGKQYIFLSPLRPEKKPIQNLLKIFYMPEPKRVIDQNA